MHVCSLACKYYCVNVVAATLKSMMLSYVEALQNIKEAQTSGNRANLPSYQLQATELQKTLALFREGIMLLDEVDLILHRTFALVTVAVSVAIPSVYLMLYLSDMLT